MNIEEVPQDRAYMIEGKVRDVCYAVDKDGQYTKTLSLGWQPKNDAIDLAWEEINLQTEKIRLKVIQGKKSPLALYMAMKIMDVSTMAAYMGFSSWRVRRHMRMKPFMRMASETLKKYAEILQITIEELTDLRLLQSKSPKNDH
jgi:hypothetical protein